MKTKNILATFLILMTTQFCLADNATKSGGNVFKETPTIHCLGVRWAILGDANKNATIHVNYRKKGKQEWLKGYPLFRTRPNPHNSNRSRIHTVKGGWMFAGSILGLEEDTEYEVKLRLEDPDGGKVSKQLTMKTWKEPTEPKGMVTKYVIPGDGGGTGTKADPFKGSTAAVATAAPGNLFQFAKGSYSKFSVKANGTEQKPIIFRGPTTGEANIDGGGSSNPKVKPRVSVIRIKDRKHLWFENLSIRNGFYAINGNSSSNIVVRRCKFRNVAKGFNAQNGGYKKSVHHFIVDNDYLGPTKWPRERGIETFCLTYMSGSGHIVAYNKISNAGDAVHGTGHGSWSACDIYSNEANICTDDAFETDHSEFNIRVWGNVIRNVAHGITAQPSRGGPTYIFRNVIYNATYSPFKLNNHTTGVMIFHNTCFKNKNAFNIVPAQETVTNIRMRNNLFLCHMGTGLYVGTRNMKLSDFDNDGYGGFKQFARWNGKINYKTVGDAKSGGQIYKDKGAYLINPKTCFASKLLPPADKNKTYTLKEIDYRLAPKSDAVDKGVVLPNFNDGFKGKAPDLGALEEGQPLPHVGPRPLK
ncbi:MAG: hypothetical protein COA79_17255 [Planctomycetota bacterium]|nr:MAG: hypothetical protein COA79_17255 [Planctomycetota bacterium]